MKPMVTCHQVLDWIRLVPFDETATPQRKVASSIFALVLFICNMNMVAASTTFLVKNISNDLAESLYSLFQISAYCGGTYGCFIGFILRRDIRIVFDKLSKIYDENSDLENFQFLARANEKSEWLWRKYAFYAQGGFLTNAVTMSTISIVICYLMTGGFDAKLTFHPHRTLLPWNQHTFAGYIGEIVFDIVSSESYLLANAALLLLFISMCWHHQAFYERFENSLRKLDYPDSKRNDKELLCELVLFQMSVKDWFLYSVSVYSPIILIQLICSMAFLACNIFQLELQLRDISFDIAYVLITFLTGASNLFFYCFFGKLGSESYVKMSDCLYESNWRGVHVDLQKYFILMIANSQRPIYYTGFGLAYLNLESYTGMLKTVLTYYMMCRTMTTY